LEAIDNEGLEDVEHEELFALWGLKGGDDSNTIVEVEHAKAAHPRVSVWKTEKHIRIPANTNTCLLLIIHVMLDLCKCKHMLVGDYTCHIRPKGQTKGYEPPVNHLKINNLKIQFQIW
jgi:hypothetical protein